MFSAQVWIVWEAFGTCWLKTIRANMSLVLLASLLGIATPEKLVNGQPHCPCLGVLPDMIPRVPCEKPWHVYGKCVTANVQGKEWLYPRNYGVTCQTWLEPGHTDCFHTEMEIEKPRPSSDREDVQASWCIKEWRHCLVHLQMLGTREVLH
eukprot:gnl/TRDRNA2_/TRDRNA2_151423_c0_seq1.p1 gnl/TRDRNA2_/TRDRNA2_151423_c0~~gnl/TRDRNA2_/TRDRNA2_151423_c0_seq1.p1  ORF type:complete len:163 (+),score=10.59 gnl/TRDRNA2_/TRDRNA2_151423_c0_seq1:38-490(+)